MQPTTINFTPPSTATHDILTLVALVAMGVTVLVHLIIAIAIMNDAIVLPRQGGRLMFFTPLTWAFLGLATGLLALLAYWLMHHSSFRAVGPPADTTKV